MPRARASYPRRSDGEAERLIVAGREVLVSNPGKVLFPAAKHTKLDLVRYYLAVAEGALRAAGGRPNMLVRYPNGVDDEHFYQKRAPTSRPPWIEVVMLRFPSGRRADEVVPRDAASLAWLANLACLELHPHPVRAEDLDHPDELRVDLDPVRGIDFEQVRAVARVVEATLKDFGLVGWPKTSGSRGVHVNVRIERRWSFDQVRRAALALAREVEHRAPDPATRKWKEGRTARRVRRLQSECQGPHRRRGVLGATQAGCPRVRSGNLGGTRDLRPRGVYSGDDARPVRQDR